MQLLLLNSIQMDGGTQPRATTDMFTVDEYASAMRDGAIFPPVVAFFDGSDYWLADGFHRVEAAKRAGMAEINADVRDGQVSDAQWFSYGVNLTHGLRRSNADKEHAVKAALTHANAAARSDNQIARHCGVTPPTVAKYRAELGISKSFRDTRIVERNGQIYEIDTSNIGKRAEQPQIERLPFDDDDNEPLSPYEQSIADQYFAPKPIEQAPALPIVAERTIERIGQHVIICGDNTDQWVIDAINAELDGAAALAFADPPYNAGVAAWDDGSFQWDHDHLIGLARVVAVTPGIGNIPEFMRLTAMPYKWSAAAFIKNGMTRGALGFGNWMYTAIFSHGSIYRQKQDIQLITINPTDANDAGAKRQKPPQYLQWLFELFTQPGEIIIDAFGGSGASVVVAEKIGRRCICIERDPQAFAQIIDRVRDAIEQEIAA